MLFFNKFKNKYDIDYSTNIYFFVFLFSLLAFHNYLFFNEEMVICISLILYFFGILIILRKIVSNYFFFGSEMLYLLFYLLIILNIIYIKVIIKYLNVRNYEFIVLNQQKSHILFNIIFKNYYLLFRYYKIVFLYFINLFNLKNKLRYLEIVESFNVNDKDINNKNVIIGKTTFYVNYMSLISLNNVISNYVS
jgi:hypothetical protein